MARWNSCNVLQVAPDANRLWQFGAKGGNFVLDREQKVPGGGLLPARLVAKSWSSLWQPKLNVAWLPPENVFLRVVTAQKLLRGNAGDGGVAVGKTLAIAGGANCLDDSRPSGNDSHRTGANETRRRDAGAPGFAACRRRHRRARGGGGISRQTGEGRLPRRPARGAEARSVGGRARDGGRRVDLRRGAREGRRAGRVAEQGRAAEPVL